jgi:phosphoribosyl 1,2-cyclic phosphate phosphodiesterase
MRSDMDFLFLGTAASEGCPGLFCDCERCIQYQEHGGRSIRLRQGALINNDLLIDIGPDLHAATRQQHLRLTNVTTLLVTHFHEDHWLSANLLYRHHWFREQPVPLLTIYGGPRLESEIMDLCNRHRITTEDMNLEYHIVQPHDRFASGNYTIQAYAATHNPSVDPLIYTIEQDDSRLIYACDTGPLSDETREGLAGFSAATLVMENTMGEEPAETHMGRADFIATVAHLKDNRGLLPDAQIIATHFSHHYHPHHEQLVTELAKFGITPAYDGMKITVHL